MLLHFLFVLMRFSLNAFSAASMSHVMLRASYTYSYDLKRWHIELSNVGDQLMLVVVSSMLDNPDNQFFTKLCIIFVDTTRLQ